MGKDTRTPREMINTLLTSNNPTILNRVQEVMKSENVQPYEARNLLYLDAINYFEQNKTLAPVNSLYTGERTKLYPLFMEKNKDFVSTPIVYNKVEDSKKDFKKQTGKDLNFVAQYDKSTGKIVTTKPILKATTDWNNDSSVAGYLFGDDSDFAYDKDLTIKAYNELGFVKGGQLKDYNTIVKQLDMDKKKKFLVEEKRAEIHNRNIEMSKVKSKYDIGQPNEQGNEVLKWMNNSVLVRPVFKMVVEPSSGAGRGQLAKDLKVFNSADYTEGQLQKSIQKNSFVADKVNFGEDNEKSRQFNDIANIATQGLLSSFEFLVGVGIVNKTAKAITWTSKLPFMGKTIPNVVDKVLKPVSWIEAKTYQDLGISKVAGTGWGGKIAQQAVVFPAKLAGAFATSAIYFGGIQKGVNKAFNPQLRNSDPNISSFQQGVRDVIEGGLEGLTEQLVFFPALKLTGKAITKSMGRKAFNLATGVISENFEEEVSNVVSDYFDLMYKNKWGGTSVIANAINGDKISQEQVNQVLGVALSTTALMGMFGSVSKVSEYMYNKEMVKTVEDLVKKHLSLDKVAQTLNDNFSGDYRDKLIMRNAMEESQILQQAFKKGLATGNATFGDKDYLNTVLSSGFNELSQLESLGFLGDMDVQKVQGIVDNIVNDVVESVPALKAFKKKTNDSKTLSYLVGNILQGRELTESQIKEDLKNTPDVDNIASIYKESVTSIKNSEKKGQLNVLNTEIKEIDSQLSYLQMLSDDSGKKFAVEKKTKQRDELVKTREAVLNDDMLLSDVIDPLLVFAQYSAKKNREFITQNNLNEELFNKAEEILQTSTPYSRKVDVAIEYLTAVKKNIEEKITSGELIGQRQKQIYTETVNQLKRYDYLETMKGNTELKTNYDILVPEVEYFKTNPEEYAKTKELYLNTVISRMFDEVPTDKEWNAAKNKFIKHMEQYAKDGKSTVDALTEFFGDKYTEDIQNTVDYLYRLHKAVNTTKKTPVISSNATSKTSKTIPFINKFGKGKKEVAVPTNIDNKSDFTENEEGKWYKRTMLLNGEGVDLFLLRNKITLSEQVKKAIMEFENTLFTESELEQWIKFKEEFINAYENNEPMDGELLKEYKFASAFLPIFYYLEKVVDVNNDGKLYESESLKSKSIAGKSSVYSQLYHNVAYFLGSNRVTSNGNAIDTGKLEKEVLRSNPIERVQKLVDKYAPVKEDTAEEITAQNELLNSLEDIKQFQDFQKKYPNNLEVKKILFVYEIAKGRTPDQFDGVINQDRVLEILEKFNLSVKEKLRVLTKGTLVGKGELVDNLNNVPDVENEILSEEIKKELLKKLPKEILTNEHIELLTELTSNRYVSSEAQKMLDDYNKRTEVEIKKDSPFESSNAIENLMDDISSLKNYPTFRGVLRGIIVDSNFDLKLFSKIEKTPANLKEIRIFIGKLAIAFTKEQMIENRNNTKFIYYSMLKQIQKTNPELLHKVKLNGEDVFLVKEEDGFDEVVEASVDNKGNVSLRRIVSPSNKPVEAPISPVEPQTPEEAIVTPTYEYLSKEDLLKEGMEINSKFDNEQNQIIGLKVNNELVGYTIVEINDSIVTVKVLFVKDTKRQKGYGSTLIKDLSDNLFPDKYVDHSFVVNSKITKMIDSIFDKSQFVYEVEEELEANLGRVIKPQNTSNTSPQPQGDTNTEEGIVSTPIEETKPVEEKQTTYIEMSEGVKGYLDKTEKELEELYNNIDRTSTKTNDELVLNVQLFISSYILLRNFDLEDVTNTKEYENLVNKYDPLAQEVLELIEKIDPKIYQEIIDKWFSGKENDFLFGFMADESKSNIEPFVEPSNIVTEEFTNEVVAKSIRSQYNFRNFKQRNGNIDVDSKVDSYFIAVPLKEHIDLAKITDNKRLKLFTNLISRIRINNNLYLEDNSSKMMILYSELIDSINDISKAELTEEEFKIFKQIIKAAVDTKGLNIDLVLKYLSGVTFTNEEIKNDTLNTISRNIIKDEKVSVPTVLSMSITDLQNTNNLMYQGYYSPEDKTIRVVKTIQGVAVHEYIHYLFDFYNVGENEDFKATDKIVESKIKDIIRLIKLRDQLELSKMFDNLSANTAMEFAKHLITAFDVSTLIYANKSATERVANLFSNPIYAHMLYAIKYENGSLAIPYLTNVLEGFLEQDFANTLVAEYLNTFELAIKTNYKPNVSDDDEQIILETPLPDFDDDVKLDVDLYGGFLTQTVQPELIDWSVSQGVKDFNTFNEDEADIIANSLKDINEDLRIAKGIDEGGNIFDLVQNISFDEFYSLVQKPLDTLKEDDPDMYNARMNLYSKFTKILHNKFGNNSHIDYSMFKTGVPLLDQENYVKRLLHDVYNKLNSVVYQPIFQIIAKETQVAHQMDFIIKPLQKGRNADGESISNYRPNMKIIEDMEIFKLVLNKIAGMNLVSSIKFKYLIDVLGKHLGESGDPNYAQSLFDENRPDNFRSEMYRTMTLIEQKDGGIFLNKFGDKNHHPVMYLNYSKKQMEKLNENQKAVDSYSSVNAFYTFVALPIYKKYRAMGIEDLKKRQVPNPQFKFLSDIEIINFNPLVVSLAMRALWEEVKKGATQDNFEVVDKEIVIKTKLKDENMITLMKRATLALEKMKMTVSQESLEYMNIDKVANIVPYQLIKGKDNLSSVVRNDTDVFFRVAFVSTKTMPPELVKLFRNKYGTFRFDGASFVVRQHFDTTYSELFGVLNEGAAKNVILPLNAFIKHAVHAIDANDTIGKWMLENNIAMLVFDESEKNKILRNENESLSRDLDTGQSVQDDSGFVSNQITDIFDLEGKTTDNPVNTYFLNIKDISRIGEKYSNETEVKALQQILNSSGLTTVNKSLGENGAKLITIMSKFSSSFADNINEFIKNVDADGNLRSKENPLYFEELISIITKHLYHIAKSPTGSLTANFAEVFDVVVYMYEKKDSKGKREISDIQIYEFMKQFAYMPLVSEAMDNFMNEVMSPNISYETKGKSLAVTPDLGRLSMPRIEGMKKAYTKQLEYDLKENELLKSKRQEFITEALNLIPADDPNRIPKAQKLANEKNKSMVYWYNAIKADDSAEDGTLEKRKAVIQNGVKSKSEKWFNEVLDEDMFIKRDYCYITDDTAKKLGLEVGDKVLVTIIPSAGGMEVKGLTIAGILNSNGSASPGTIVVNHEWFQGIGRDFDIDVLNIVTKPKSLSEEEWNFVVDEFQELEKKYVETTYNTFKEVLGEEYIAKQISKYPQEFIETLSALDKKMLIAFNDRVFTDFQKKFLGATDSFRNYYSVVENATLYLGDNFRKDVGYVIVLRTLHQYLASTRLNFKLDYIDKDGSRVSHTVDFGNKEVWNKVHISLMIGTQHQVDYPKTTSKDEYDFRAESYFTKMLGFDKPLKDLPEGLQEQISNLYQAFSKHISALRIPKYEQKEWNSELTLNKFENANEKVKAFKVLQETLLKKLVKIEGVSNPSFANKTPLNPYIAFANKLNSPRMDEVAKAMRYPKTENQHTYTKVIEYKILGKFLTDLEFPFLDMESLPYVEENLKLVAQYMWKIEGADKNGEAIIVENKDGSRGQTYKKMVDELRTKGYVDSIYYSDLLTSKSNTNPRLLPFLDGGSLRLFAKQNLQSSDPYINSISYTQAMFFEGVKDAAVIALRNGYKIVRKRIEKENNKQFNDKTVRSFLVKKYGLPEYPFKQLSDEQKKEMFTEDILKDIKKYTKRLDQSDSWYKKTAMDLESSDNYYNYVTDLLGMTEVPMDNEYSSSPKLEHYIFDFSVTTDELFVTGFTKGLFNYGLAGTFDPITSTAEKKTTTTETIKRQKEIYEITRIMSIMNQVISQKDTVTDKGVINVRQEVANKIGMANINSRYWSEIGKGIIGNPTKISDEYGVLNLQIDKDSHIEVLHKGDGVNYKLVRNNAVVEEFHNDLQANSEIYKTLGSRVFWSNSYQYKNKIEVKKFYDLQKKDTFSIDDRVIALNKIMGEYLVEEGLAERNDSGMIIPSETAQRYISLALKWMVGFNEITDMTDTLYIPGVSIDNRILLRVMRRWSPVTLFEYLQEFANNSGVFSQSTRDMLEELHYSYYDFDNNANKKPRRMSLEHYWDERRKSHQPQHYLKENNVQGGFMYAEGMGFTPKKFETLDTTQDIEDIKEEIVALARDINVLKTTSIANNPVAFTTNFKSKTDVNAWLDNSMLNIEKHIRDARIIETLKAIYIDLQLIKQSYDFESTKPKDDKVASETQFLTWLARGRERQDFTLYDDFRDDRMRLAARIVRFDKFDTGEWTEEEQKMKAFIDMTEKRSYANSEERLKDRAQAYEYEAELKRRKKNRLEEQSSDYYLINPKEAFILSQGGTPFNTQFSGLRPFGLMSLNYSKMRLLVGDLNVASQKIKGLVKEITNIVPYPAITTKINQSFQDRLRFDADVYEMSDKTLGKILELEITETNKGMYQVKIGDKVFYQNSLDDTFWIKEIGKLLNLPKDDYSLAILYSAIRLRSLFDFHLRHYISRVNYYLDMILDLELADDSTLFKNEIEKIRKKYEGMKKAFQRFEKKGDRIYAYKVTPKVFLANDVINTYAEQRYSSRMRYYDQHLNEFEPEEQERVLQLIAEDGVKPELEKEIRDRVGGSVFYVPLFSYMRDNDLGNHFPSLEMMEEHIFGALFKMIESDISTVYYYQSRIYGMRNATPTFDTFHLGKWFEQFSDALDLKNNSTDLNMLEKDQYVFFYTMQFDEEGNEQVVIKSGKVNSSSLDYLEITGFEGERVTYTKDEVFVSDFNSINKKIVGKVYVNKKLDYFDELEKKITFDTASESEKAIYYGIRGMSELFVSTQMLGIGALRTFWVNKVGGNINMLTFAGMSSNPNQIFTAFQGKVGEMPKVKSDNFNRFLSMANSMTGLQPLDVSMGSANVLGMDLPVFSKSVLNNIKILYDLRKQTQAFKGVEELKKEIYRVINKLNNDVKNGDVDVADAQDTKAVLLSILRSASYGLNMEIFGLNEIPNIVEQEDADSIYELFEKVYNDPNKMANLYGLTEKEINKAIRAFAWRGFKKFGGNFAKSPEEQLRTSSFFIGHRMALENGATMEEADLWGVRFTDMSQVVYDRFARKIGTDDVWKGFQYLMGNYAHQQQMYLKVMLDEAMYNKLVYELDRLFDYRFDEIKLTDEDQVIFIKKVSKLTKKSEFKTKIRKMDLKGKSIDNITITDNIGVNTLNRLIKILTVTSYIDYFSKVVSGLQSIQNPVIAPFLAMINLLISYIDDGEIELRDFIWTFNMLLGMKFGVGVGMMMNMATTIPIELSKGEGLVYSIWSSMTMPIASTRVGNILKTLNDIDINQQTTAEALKTAVNLIGSGIGLKINSYQMMKMPFFANLEAGDDWYNIPMKIALQTAEGILIPIPGGPMLFRLLYDLPEYNRALDKEKKNQRYQDYQENNK